MRESIEETPKREPPGTREGEFTKDGYESVSERTALINQVHGLLGEFGIVAGAGTAQARRQLVEIGVGGRRVPMMIAILPKHTVWRVMGYIKGKSTIYLARVNGEKKRNFVGQPIWAREYFVLTVGRDEAVIREYIRNQEQEDKRLEPLNLWR